MALKESGKKNILKEKKIDHKVQNNTTLVSIRSFAVVLIFEFTSDGKADTTKV